MSAPSVGAAGNIEKQMPMQSIGYFAYQVSFIKQVQPLGGNRGGSMGFTASTTGAMLATKEFNSISNHIKAALTLKGKPDWNKVAKAIETRSFAAFVAAIVPGAEITAKGKKGLKFPFGVLNLQGGVDFKHLPIIFRGFYKPKLQIPGNPHQFIIVLNMGPSLKGWTWLAQKVSPKILRQFLFSNGTGLFPRMFTVLAANSVFIGIGAATAVVSFGLFSLMALYAAHRAQQGEIVGLSTWYVSAYERTLFGDAISSLRAQSFRGNRTLRDQLIQAGVNDAIKDARTYVVNNKIIPDDPNDNLEALGRYGGGLAKKYKTQKIDSIKRALNAELMKKAKIQLSRGY